MEADALHDLTAPYALDALDPDEARAYEAHLARCERCRTELASLSEAATALAFGTEAPPARAELRTRILQQARDERPNVVPLRPRWALPAAASVAAVAACAAIGFGLWAASLSNKLDSRKEALARLVAHEHAITGLLARSDSRLVTTGHGTSLVVTGTGDAALVVRDLPSPGRGWTYEAWVAHNGAPKPAGLFGGGSVVAVRLAQPVRPGATVMVTKEVSGGTTAPTSQPFITVPYRAQS